MKLLLLLLLLSVGVIHSFSLLGFRSLHKSKIASSVDDVEDDEDYAAFRKLAGNYLTSKFLDCNGDDCINLRDKSEIGKLLKVVLPPISKKALEEEVTKILSRITTTTSEIDVTEFTTAVLDNTYWKQAGPLVVKELIFLDCLYNYYYGKRNLLNNDDYNDLKEQLNWEGSAACSLKANEALFITAVAGYLRGDKIMDDDQYEKVKTELQSQGSWVVTRGKDPLEKLGLNTFMSYLHTSL